MAGTNKNSHKNLQLYLADFDHKRKSVRENSLELLVNSLNSHPRRGFVEENHITLCHSSLTRLNSKKKGSNTFSKLEICLAIRAVSLLAINLVNQDFAHQVFDDCLPVLTDALARFESEIDVIVELLVCVGIVGFFCSNHSSEIEQAMVVVWEFMVNSDDHQSSVLEAAVSSWSFLLSGVHKNNLSKKLWKKSISFFSGLLERKDSDILGVKIALELIYEFDSIQNFSDEFKEGEDYSLLKKEISQNVSQTVQVKVLKKFLGKEGFGCHMKDNENFHGLFEFVSSQKGKTKVDQTPEREEVVLKFYRNEVEERQDCDELLPFVSEKEKKVQYRFGKSPNSSLNKARTQLRNKQRKVVNPDFVESELHD